MNLNCIEKIRESLIKIEKEKEVYINGIIISNSSNIKYILKKDVECFIYIEKEYIYIITDGRYIEEIR